MSNYTSKLRKLIDDIFSLKTIYPNIKESDFDLYKQEHSQRLINNFLDVALVGIIFAFGYRMLFLQSVNTSLDLILPFVIMMLISFLYQFNKRSPQLKHYFHVLVIPLVGMLSAKKSIS